MSRPCTITILPTHAQECLRKLATAKGFFLYAVEATKCKSGNLSVSYEVTLRCNDKQICFFIKCIPEDIKTSPFLPLEGFFANELFVYRYVTRLFEKLQVEAKVPEHERFRFPQFHETSSKRCLVLENMALKGYTVTERRSSLTLSVATMAVERLAQYHALSIAVAQGDFDFFREVFMVRKHMVDFVGLHQRGGGEEEVYRVIELLNSSASKLKVKRFVQDMMRTMTRLYGSDLNIGVLCHGDFRGQNLMTLTLNGDLTDVLPIDYQLVHYGHPLNDLMYFLFLATDHKFRRRHMHAIKTKYYATLKKYLPYFGLSVEEVYPVRDFEKDFKERLPLGLIQGLRLLPLMLASCDDVPEIFGETPQLNVARNDILIEWINGLVEEFVEWGYL